MDMTLAWLSSRMPLGPRFLGCVDCTVTKYGMKPLTELGLRLPLRLGKQKKFTTLKPSALYPSIALNQILLQKWPI